MFTAFANWGVNLPGLQDAQKLDTERDFMALNRAALSAGLVTAPENYRLVSDMSLQYARIMRSRRDEFI